MASSLTTALDGMSVSETLQHGQDPHEYLGRLTPHTDQLLALMRKYSVILSGSRASGFFYPKSAREGSDYDFYCYSTLESVAGFMIGMERIGAQFYRPRRVSEDRGVDVSVGSRDTTYSKHLSIVTGNLGRRDVQLLFARGMSPLDHVLGFHSSVVQCFITGYCAVSMYDVPSSTNRNYAWSDSSDAAIRHADATACLKKYSDRGFWKTCPVLRIDGQWQTADARYAVRSVGDVASSVVDFLPYLNELTEQEDDIHDEVMRAIKGIQWVEEERPKGGDVSLFKRGSTTKLHRRCELRSLLEAAAEEPLRLSCRVLRPVGGGRPVHSEPSLVVKGADGVAVQIAPAWLKGLISLPSLSQGNSPAVFPV